MRKTFGVLYLAASMLAIGTSAPAFAVPITISNAGYFLETVGVNPFGLAGGGSLAGTTRTLFIANTDPPPANGTTASANFSGTPTFAPELDGPTLWARGQPSPSAAQLAPLTVVFQNGPDTASFTGRDLRGLTPLSLVQNLTVDSSVDPLGPLIRWTLPTGAGDVDFISVVFYDTDTGLEVGSRQTLTATATSYDIVGPLRDGFHLTVNVRLIDLFDDTAPLTSGNILRQSRAYVNYAAVAAVPEPETYAMMAVGLLALARFSRATRNQRTPGAAR